MSEHAVAVTADQAQAKSTELSVTIQEESMTVQLICGTLPAGCHV